MTACLQKSILLDLTSLLYRPLLRKIFIYPPPSGWVILAYMSAANAIFNVAALAFSFLAILISAISARRQAGDARRGNLILFVTELGQKTRTPDFIKARDYVLTELSKLDPALGVYGLPEPARDYVLLVGDFYQDVASLVVSGVLDENLVAARYYSEIKQTWRALQPYILSEREIRRVKGTGGIFVSFEHLAAYVQSVPYEKLTRNFGRRRFPATEVDDGAPVGATLMSRDGESQPQSPDAG